MPHERQRTAGGFTHPGDPAEPDGAQVFLDDPRMDTSINATLVNAGLVYPAFYDTLPADLCAHLADVFRAARAAGAGIWPRSTADPVFRNIACLQPQPLDPVAAVPQHSASPRRRSS